MPRGDKSKYTDKQQRKAEHIEESYEKRGVSEKEAEAQGRHGVLHPAEQSGGGERKGGSGKGKSETAKRADRKDSAHRAADARKGKSPNKGSARSSGSSSTSLADMTRDQLMDKARERDIRGRSKMRKDELLKALS